MKFNFSNYGDAYAEKKAITMEITKTFRDHGDEGADLIEKIDLEKSFLYEDRWEDEGYLMAWFNDEAGANGDPLEFLQRIDDIGIALDEINRSRIYGKPLFWRFGGIGCGFIEFTTERDYSDIIEEHAEEIVEYYDDPDNEEQPPAWLAPLLEKYKEIDRICCALA